MTVKELITALEHLENKDKEITIDGYAYDCDGEACVYTYDIDYIYEDTFSHNYVIDTNTKF